jgi:hypothetical protein
MSDQTVSDAPAPEPQAMPTIGQGVWFYDPDRTTGLKSHDNSNPFAATVVDVLSDRLVNLVVFDHIGTMFPMRSVAVFLGDDKDNHAAPCHVELEAPKPKEAVAISGVEGDMIPLNLVETTANLGNASSGVKSAAITFTVPVGDSYRFISEKAAVDQTFQADAKAQTLALTSAQIKAGALSDLSLTTTLDGEATLSVAIVEQTPAGLVGRTYTFVEVVTVAVAPDEPAADPADPAFQSTQDPAQPTA